MRKVELRWSSCLGAANYGNASRHGVTANAFLPPLSRAPNRSRRDGNSRDGNN